MAWRVIGGSAAGTTHVKNGLGCDDAHGWLVGDERIVLAVADGAGSRPGTSMIGSHVAVAAVLDAPPEATMTEFFAAAHAAVLAEAEALDLEPGMLATTLCVAVLEPGRARIGQVGDGIAVIETEAGMENVALAEQFEYANVTVFLTSEGGPERHLREWESDKPVSAVGLSTDGLRYKALANLQTREPFEPFFRDSWAYARGAGAISEPIVRFIDEVEDQTGDDKTLLVAVDGFEGEPGEGFVLSPRPEPAESPS
jgi:Protein phosphatase 2C